ncbi:MAG: antitoxin family protein [Chloroflexota bacterium]
MIAHPVRAIYERGHLRLLDPVDLTEGQEIQLLIVSERERARAVLADILLADDSGLEVEETMDEAALFAEIDANTTTMQGKPTISDAIIEERREGP